VKSAITRAPLLAGRRVLGLHERAPCSARLEQLRAQQIPIEPMQVSYFLSRNRLVPGADTAEWWAGANGCSPRWSERGRSGDYFSCPQSGRGARRPDRDLSRLRPSPRLRARPLRKRERGTPNLLLLPRQTGGGFLTIFPTATGSGLLTIFHGKQKSGLLTGLSRQTGEGSLASPLPLAGEGRG